VIFILDYGASNLRSVKKAFDYLGIAARITHQPAEITSASKILLPGVGAFGKGMEALCRSGFAEAIAEHVDKGRDLLGICLGMQLLLTQSEEMGLHDGLNLLEGYVRQFDKTKDKVPQIGWNSLDHIRRDSVLFKGIDEGTYFYFVHSYYCDVAVPDCVAAEAFYAGTKFATSIEKNNIFAVQFHPEKSGSWGLKVLKNFAQH
jgi:glutamine amidotransferase